MLHKIRERAQSEKGFTLIELLVVILIIGILAAIALPAFLGQREKAQDSSAKSDARNMVSEIESCYVETESYTLCVPNNTANDPGNYSGTGLNVAVGAAPAKGQVGVASANATSYVITAKSQATTAGRDFLITKVSGGPVSRTCTPVGGGCKTLAANGW